MGRLTQPIVSIIFAVIGALIGATGGIEGAAIGGFTGAASSFIFTVLQIAADASRKREPFSFSVEITSPSLTHHQIFPSYSANLIVKNRLRGRHFGGCRLHVLEVSAVRGRAQFPRLIDQFDVAAFAERRVAFAYWTRRDPPYNDDDSIGIAGPPAGAFYNGNFLRVAATGSTLRLRVYDGVSHFQELYCHVSVEERRLSVNLNG